MAEAAETGGDVALEGGNYEVIRKRLVEGGKALRARAEQLNTARQEVFGGTELTVIANERVRTEHNCVPCDIIAVGSHLLFGFNVKMGLKQETAVGDVFGLHDFEAREGGFDFPAVTDPGERAFLDDPTFVKDFTDLYKYYRDCTLQQLRRTDTRLLMVFRIGAGPSDLKVLRYQVNPDGSLKYVDNRGDRDHVFPASHDFEWRRATREMQVMGKHPHFNILDTVFVETVGGDLTVKVEDNTDSGQGVYAEPVDEPNQVLDDAEVYFADLGGLILLKVLPYREKTWRYLVFNKRSQEVVRVDAIGRACVQLPEDHGIIFPGGYYLQAGQYKVFDDDTTDLEFKRVIKSPNGEDVLYVFYRRRDGHYALLPYNLIRKEVANPIHCHGYSLFADGRMVVFRSVNDEPTRVHPMQVWQTPFMSAEFAASAPTDGSFLAKVGNAELVRGISDAFSIARLIDETTPSRGVYEDLIGSLNRMRDAYFWLGRKEAFDLKSSIDELARTAELIIDEFEKVLALRARAAQALADAEAEQARVIKNLQPEDIREVDEFLKAMTALRRLRGHLITLREVRFIDLERIEQLEKQAVEGFDRVSKACVEFLLRKEALDPLKKDIEALLGKIEATKKVTEVEPLRARTEELSQGLDLLGEVVGGLQIDDATQRTAIIEGISEVFSQLNRVRATLEAHRKAMLGAEGRADFAAQFKLFGQTVASALALCDTPERCDEELSRLAVQLEELEARFSEFDEFLGDLASKREETFDAFGARKQTLLDERQRRAQNVVGAAERILEGVRRRVRKLKDEDELNAYFASDAMIMKLRQLAEQLVALGDGVKGEELLGRLKAARQDALRGLRDKLELFEGGDNLIKLGNHRFPVNTQPLEMTLLPRGDGMALHLTGTDFYEPLQDAEFEKTRDYWQQTLVSEDAETYRAEYLAATLLFAAEEGRDGLSVQKLHDAVRSNQLLEIIRQAAQSRYDEGYERGLHDADCAAILEKLLSMHATAGLLRYGPAPRAVAALAWGGIDDDEARRRWQLKARSLARLRESFGPAPEANAFAAELAGRIDGFLATHGLDDLRPHGALAGRYLADELATGGTRSEGPRFTTSRDAVQLRDALIEHLRITGTDRDFDEDLRALQDDLAGRLALARAWIGGLASTRPGLDPHLLLEAAVLVATGDALEREISTAVTEAEVQGLLGNHPRVTDRKLPLRLDAFIGRLRRFIDVRVPGYRRYRELRHAIIEQARARLRLDEFQPKVMSAFVRNRLINEVYLPLVGANLAKQMGSAGENKRTDQMGLLLLISPPGYGKTTLMEYVANRLGLVFVKVNGPALGHAVHSLDPAEAPNATARQEVEKINLALEMGNNVMLYLDDIQHTHPELLQKFISLCDAQRRIEGVWRGRTRTYDLRGKKFCVVMAGNPYTESGEKFQIPDMLSNRADTYNLGDILEGKDDVFALSYIENALTSNPALAPLATRDQQDVYQIIRMARGEEVATTDLKHGYSGVELAEIKAVFQHLFRIQEVILKVNLQYIASASMDDDYRTEPSFKLQGSYRNMNKMAEKVVSAMTPDEVLRLIDDHYNGESQTLTTGAEHNLLKLAELRGRMTDEQKARWAEVKRSFQRVKTMGGRDDDPVARVTGTLGGLGDKLEAIEAALARGASSSPVQALSAELSGIREALKKVSVGDRLDGIRDALKQQSAQQAAVAEKPALLSKLPPKPPPDADLAPVLRELAAALQKVTQPRVAVTVENKPPAGVEELLAQQVAIVERTLVPLVKTSTDNLKDAQALGENLERLMAMLKEIDAKLRGRN